MKKLIGTFVFNSVTFKYDGQTFNGRSEPLVICPLCGSERRVSTTTAQAIKSGHATGACLKCRGKSISKAKKGKLRLTSDESLPSGSIIHWSERTTKYVPVTCGICGKRRMVVPNRNKGWTGYCNGCNTRREKHHNWKGGKFVDGDGYVQINITALEEPDRQLAEPMSNNWGYVLEHRFVMAKKLGRSLASNEIVHHLNGNKSDNRPENLELVRTPSEHNDRNKKTIERLRREIARLQQILDDNDILY